MAEGNKKATWDPNKVVTVKMKDGSVGWRVRDENGTVIKPHFGHIHGLTHGSPEDDAAYRRPIRVIEQFLKRGVQQQAKTGWQKAKPVASRAIRKPRKQPLGGNEVRD